ncbi:MAG: AMP-binding protein [Acidobacteriota bacterium]
MSDRDLTPDLVGPPLHGEMLRQRPLGWHFERMARSHPDRVFLHSLALPEESRTFGEFHDEARRVATCLVELGLTDGARIGLIAENRPRWCVAHAAALLAGAVIVPIDAQTPAAGLAAILSDCDAKGLFFSDELAERAAELEERGWSGTMLGLDEHELGRTWSELSAGRDDVSLPTVAGGDNTAVLVYTSGTTGDPKGVILTHRNLQAELLGIQGFLNIAPSDVLLMFLPLQHVLSQIGGYLLPGALGLRCVHARITNGEELLEVVREEEITILVAVPMLYHLMHQRVESALAALPFPVRAVLQRLRRFNGRLRRRFDLDFGPLIFGKVHALFGPQLRLMVSGGSPLDPKVQSDFLEMGLPLCQVYGLTETTGGATFTPLADVEVATCGQPGQGVSVRIDKPDAEGIGEICIGGEILTPGYHGRPEATAALLQDGWLHTGDLGRITPQGNVQVTGRSKDVIVLGSGKNIYPEELEAHYAHSPWVEELCVLGRDSGGASGEKLHAVVVPDWSAMRREGVTSVREKIFFELEQLSFDLPSYQRVLSFELRRDPLPRTPTRKLQRYKVETGVGEDAAPAELPPDEPEVAARLAGSAGQVVAEMLQARMDGDAKVQGRSSFELDLGLDSLNRMEALLSIENALSIQFDDDEVAELQVVDELVQLCEQKVEARGGSTEGARESGWGAIVASATAEDLPEHLRERRKGISLVALQILIRWIGRWTFFLLFRLTAKGRHHLPQEGPYLVCPNHVSFLDGFLVSTLFPKRVVAHSFVLGEAEYVEGGLAGWFSSFVGLLPTDPNRYLRKSLRQAAAGLKQGRVLLIFPEGTRSVNGCLQELRFGSAVLATELDIPIVPVRIEGAYEAWPRGQTLPRPKKCRVAFGPPLHPREVLPPNCQGEQAHAKMTKALQAALIDLGVPMAEDGPSGYVRGSGPS